LDCAGECGGDAVVDECGECNGDGESFLCEDGSLACNEDSCISFDGCDLPNNSLYLLDDNVLYNSSQDIGGFQFELFGGSIISVSGGDAGNAGFTISSSESIVLGFSFEGSVIPAGCGTLLTFLLDGEGQYLTDIIVSDALGNSIDFTYFEGDEDCPSGIYDCNGDCEGSAIVDDCGVCDGLNECYGCIDQDALNFDPTATIDDGTCEYADYSNSIVITEIHYNPSLAQQGSDAEYEFIELYNKSDDDISLDNWLMQTANVNFVFGANSSIPSQSYILLKRDTGVYLGDNVIVWGSDRLENSNDFIYLYDNVNQLVDFVEFVDVEPWPPEADAGGSSLELININSDNNNAENWQASLYIGGTPGALNFIPLFGCTDSTACNFDDLATTDNGSCEYAQENFDCDGNCLVDLDCAGECGGDAVADECGECNGDGPQENFDCDGNCLLDVDCEGVCGGDAIEDSCGVCNGFDDDCVEGCTDIDATNYNPDAIFDDNSCFYAGANYPDWDDNVDSVFDNYNDYEFSMSITSLVYMDNMSILGEHDMLAAFVDGELRGVSQALLVPTALGHELSFQILIYSNLEFGDVVSFKYYNFTNDIIHVLNESVEYASDTFIGDVNNPFLFTYNLDTTYYSTNLENTGNSSLFIFTDNVNLNFGDEIGLFDFNGIQETSLDCNPSFGETLVGSGVWQNQQTEIVAIESVDLCEFGGFLLGGFQANNNIVIKVFSNNEQIEYYAIPTYTIGDNLWGQPIYVIDSLELIEESEFFIEIDPLLLNLISVNVASANSNIENMFSDEILLIFDDESNFYIPDYGVNQIGDYNYAEGYMMFSLAEEEVEMNMTGQVINHDHPILLDPYKANMIPYFHQDCLPAEYAFSSIQNELLLVKDDEGQYYIPASNINTLNYICPGNAYIVFTNTDYSLSFNYPEMIAGRNAAVNNDAILFNEQLLSQHNINKTGISTPIVIHNVLGDYNIGDDLLVYANDKKVGVAKITGEFPIIVSAWESFEYNNLVLSGYNKDDVINMKLFSANLGTYISLTHDFPMTSFNNQLVIEGVVHNSGLANHPESFMIKGVHPNPFNPAANITIDVNISGIYDFAVYNLRGQCVYSMQMQYDNPGEYTLGFDGNNLTSGIYIAVINNGITSLSQKLTLIK
jgi:hypothetical protein